MSLDKMMSKTIMALSSAIEAKDSYTEGHSKRVAEYSREIAKKLGLSEYEQQEIYYAGLLHDVGKIRIPEKIIKKQGKLSDMEYSCLKLHPVMSYNMLKGITDNKKIENAVKYHHERFDGRGYPEGLKEENIPLYARILCVADSYDAMTSDRRYKNIFPQSFVRAEMEMEIGTQFDSEVAKAMLELIDEDKNFEMRQADSVGKRILAVDDDPISLKVIDYILGKESNYKVDNARDGVKCLEMMEKNSYDLILLDVEMPEMDGFDTLNHIRRKYNVPVVIVSGDKDITSIVKANQCGVKYYLIKPFLKQELTEVVRNIFQHNLE